MSIPPVESKHFDVFIIGGGINGAGIARDAAGRGFSVCLCEANDFASGTSSASTKLFHGGLRYLEYFEFRLVREALVEREILLRAMPHISWPMRFVLPLHNDMRFEGETPVSKLLSWVMPWLKGRRPDWLIRFGLVMYDNLGGRKILPPTKTISLAADAAGKPLKNKFKKAYEYSDCWVEDSRLVILNLRDAEAKGAQINPRTQVSSAKFSGGQWQIAVKDEVTGKERNITASLVINAAGPWADEVLRSVFGKNNAANTRLVRGSHIVIKKKFDHDRCYFFQNADGRIIFAIPYERDYTLIGTTDRDHADMRDRPKIAEDEVDYLCRMASEYFEESVVPADIAWTYSGVRPLYDDGASSAQSATREYVLKRDPDIGEGRLINIFGGKITTYRKLAESVLEEIEAIFGRSSQPWTEAVPLPGGDIAMELTQEGPFKAYENLCDEAAKAYSFIEPPVLNRLVRQYGTEAFKILGEARVVEDLGHHFGHGLYETEVRFLIDKEWARTAEDVLFRRTKQGIRMDDAQVRELETYMRGML